MPAVDRNESPMDRLRKKYLTKLTEEKKKQEELAALAQPTGGKPVK